MTAALIISENENFINTLRDLIEKQGLSQIDSCNNLCSGEELLKNTHYDMVIINSLLQGDDGSSLAKKLSSERSTQVILLCQKSVYPSILSAMEQAGVLLLAKPLSSAMVTTAIHFAKANYHKINLLQPQTSKLEQKIQDIKLIDKAKYILISNFGMSEQEAHKYVEKHAMDKRINKRMVAQKIIQTYDF